jgi:hypothetical protein
VDGATTCSRLGCNERAVAVFAFDARECLVWLDPLGGQGRGAGMLCELHADRMSPPRGWNLLDRRSAESRLWIGRTAMTTAPLPSRRTVTTRPRECPTPNPALPFDAPAAREAEPTRPRWSPHDRPGPDFEHVLDARTPMLARAFEGSRPVDEPQ